MRTSLRLGQANHIRALLVWRFRGLASQHSPDADRTPTVGRDLAPTSVELSGSTRVCEVLLSVRLDALGRNRLTIPGIVAPRLVLALRPSTRPNRLAD